MVKIALAGIVVVLCALLLKNEKAEYAVFISMSFAPKTKIKAKILQALQEVL